MSNTQALFSVAFALAAGLLMTRLLKKTKLNFPDVTVYLVCGLLIGPYFLGKFNIPGCGFNTMDQLAQLEIFSQVALGFIAFSIGNEFKLSSLKGTGKQAFVVGVVQSLGAMVVVDIVLIIVHMLVPQILSIPAAVTLGAIATATAPAATLMVVRQYKAHGKLTDILLPVVALDDAVGLVAFSVSFGIAKTLISGNVDVAEILVNPLIEIVCSLLLGSIMGIILTKLEELFYSNTNRLTLSISFVLFTIVISSLSFKVGEFTVSFSSLLVCMVLGSVLCNLCPRSGDIMSRVESWTSPLNTLFFVISGAELEISVFRNWIVVAIGLIYIVFRSFGKYYGARFSAESTHCDSNICKYLGFALLPQAGVALGMCVQAEELGVNDGRIIKNIILFSVLVYELIGPSVTKWALTKSGDIETVPEHKTNHKRFATPKDYTRRH